MFTRANQFKGLFVDLPLATYYLRLALPYLTFNPSSTNWNVKVTAFARIIGHECR